MKTMLQGAFNRKIQSAEDLARTLGPFPREKRVVMCHGTFDIVHPGHIRHLLYARDKGDVLVVSVTADEHIMKANYRPHVPEALRAMNLAALEMVDYVVVDRNATPIENIRRLQPDLFVKGFEYGSGPLPRRRRRRRIRSKPTAARSSSRRATWSSRPPPSSRASCPISRWKSWIC